MTCPYCGARQQPKKQHITWPNGKKEIRLVYDYECDECAATQEVDRDGDVWPPTTERVPR